jgi:tetratricopeptide (TPR) repeat protein
MTVDSAVARRSNISRMVTQGVTDVRVVQELFRDGTAITDEAALWDFKRELPVLPSSKLNQILSSEYDVKFSEIVKDSIAFYNTYGGYLLVGIDDTTRAVVGFNKLFDAADLNKRIQGATGHSVETIFRTVQIELGTQTTVVGLLLIPKRSSRVRPAQFKKGATKSPTGRVAYEQNDVYFRQLDSCKKAITAEELEFLFSSREIDVVLGGSRIIENNLPARDIELSKFVGRDKELYELWLWLGDAFSPVKILSGLGGVGKTSIAYTFAERLIYEAKSNVDRVIWLGAKEESFSATKAKMIPTQRVNFSTIDNVLEELLQESGCPPQLIPDNPSRDQLMHLVREHLSMFSYLIVLDNVDSLSDDDQQIIFHMMMQLCSLSGTKAVITARRNLGAPRPVYMQVDGLTIEDFIEFIIEKYDALKLKPSIDKNSVIITELYDASNGSPLFALSILRLFALGDPIRDAIRNWKGLDGNDVRNAAFKREIGRLNGNEARVLLVLCYLGRASADEIGGILGFFRYDVQNALETLQGFSMTGVQSALPGGAVFEIPSTLSLVADLVEKRVADWKVIRSKCLAHEKLTENLGFFVGEAVRRTIGRLNARDFDGAKETVNTALGQIPNHPDLLCLRGKVFLEADDHGRAEEDFAKSFDLGCRKRELFEGWLSVLERREEWRELDRVALLAEQTLSLCQYRLRRVEAIVRLGDQFSRSSENETAEQTYRRALEILKSGLRIYNYPADRSNVKRMNEIVISRWLGAIAMASSRHEGGIKRFVGACVKAMATYKSNDARIVEGALNTLNDWLSRVSSRTVTTNADVERALVLKSRLIQLESIIQTRIRTSLEKREELAKQTREAMQRLDKVVAQTAA